MRDRIDLRQLISREHEPAEHEEVDVERPRLLFCRVLVSPCNSAARQDRHRGEVASWPLRSLRWKVALVSAIRRNQNAAHTCEPHAIQLIQASHRYSFYIRSCAGGTESALEVIVRQNQCAAHCTPAIRTQYRLYFLKSFSLIFLLHSVMR